MCSGEMRGLLAACMLATGAVLAGAAGTTAHAADTNGQFAVRGVGGQRCQQLSAQMNSGSPEEQRIARIAYESWLSGYLSHVNRSSESTFDASPIINGTDLLALLIRQCQKQPDALVETMTAGVILALSGARLETASPVVSVTDGERSRTYREGTIVQVQRKLVALGHKKGEPNGVYDFATGMAVAAFQRDAGREATGFLDAETLIDLLLD